GTYVTESHGRTLRTTPRIKNSSQGVLKRSGAVFQVAATTTQNAAGISGKLEMPEKKNGAVRKTETHASVAAAVDPVNVNTQRQVSPTVAAARTMLTQPPRPSTTAVSVSRIQESAPLMSAAVITTAAVPVRTAPPVRPLHSARGRPLSEARTLRSVIRTC